MTALSDLVRGLSEGFVFRRPAQLPVCLVVQANIYAKYGLASISNLSVEACFSSYLANRGAVAQVTSADTWTTVCNISGGGYLGWVVAPHTTSDTMLRITSDGIARTITSTSNVSGYRLFAGSFWGGYQATAVGGTIPGSVANYYDRGYTAPTGSELFRKIQQGSVYPTANMLVCGLPVLRFETSLLVEAKTAANGLSGANAYAGAAYCLDW